MDYVITVFYLFFSLFSIWKFVQGKLEWVAISFSTNIHTIGSITYKEISTEVSFLQLISPSFSSTNFFDTKNQNTITVKLYSVFN